MPFPDEHGEALVLVEERAELVESPRPWHEADGELN